MARKLWTTSEIHCRPSPSEAEWHLKQRLEAEDREKERKAKHDAIDAWMKKREELLSLPPIGSVLEVCCYGHFVLVTPGDTATCRFDRDEVSYMVKCIVPDTFDKDPRWAFHAGPRCSGLVCWLDKKPEQAFTKVKITGHSNNKKCVFGKVVE